MAAKLEWVYKSRGFWTAGKWEIWVDVDGRFYVTGLAGNGGFASLDGAKKCCQAKEAAPPAELPAVGDVWGVPGRKETRRMVSWSEDGKVAFIKVNQCVHCIRDTDWQSWVRESGAVRIDGEGKYDTQWREERARVRELELQLDAGRKTDAEIEQILGRALGYPKYADDQENFPGAVGDEVCVGEHVAVTLASEAAARMAALEAENAELRERCEKAGQTTHWSLRDRAETAERRQKELEGEVARLRKEHEAVQAERNRLREWKASVSNAIQNIPEFAAGQWGGDKDGWGYHFEVVQYLIRNRDELRTKVGLMEEEAKEMERDMPLKGATYVRVGRAAGRAEMRERAEKAEKERDDLRAARGRLLDALRGIEQDHTGACCHGGYNRLRDKARKAREREEGVKS